MTHAYDKEYLDDAMRCLGEAMDYAANGCGMSMDEFLSLFIGYGYAHKFAVGVPKLLSGTSGTELAIQIVNKAAAATLLSLSKALGCQIEDLPEADYGEIEDSDE